MIDKIKNIWTQKPKKNLNSDQIQIAISVSWKIEELNVLLELFKLNFKKKYEIHVFCNLVQKSFIELGPHIRWDLIDHFYLHPMEGCGNKVEIPSTKVERRHRLVKLFSTNIGSMGERGEPFILLEGDTFPLDEVSFLNAYQLLNNYDIVGNLIYFDKVIPENTNTEEQKIQMEAAKKQAKKMPKGFVLPAPLYFTSNAALKMASWMRKNREESLSRDVNLEGMIGEAVHVLKLKQRNYSDVFTFAHPRFRQVDPVTSVIHQHCIPNMATVFQKRGFNKGDWVRGVSEGKPFKRIFNGELIEANGDIPELCALDMVKCCAVSKNKIATLPRMKTL